MNDREVSRTAYGIAVALHQLATDPRFASAPLVPAPAHRLVAAVVERLASPRLRSWLRRPGAQAWLDRLERWILPGARLHFALRKRRIESWVRAELALGERQLVVLAAGFDSLAWRLQIERPGLTLIEIDGRATQQVKRDALQSLGFREEGLELLPADFARETLDHVLARSRLWRPADPAIFVAEGLFMYLETPLLTRLGRLLAGPPGAERTLVFSYLEREDGMTVGFREANPWLVPYLRWKGEPLLSAFQEGELRDFLAETGWSLVEKIPDAEWASGIELPIPFPATVGESLVLARTFTSD